MKLGGLRRSIVVHVVPVPIVPRQIRRRTLRADTASDATIHTKVIAGDRVAH